MASHLLNELKEQIKSDLSPIPEITNNHMHRFFTDFLVLAPVLFDDCIMKLKTVSGTTF